MRRIGAQIVEEKKRDAMATMPAASRDVVNASQMGGRDLLSVLGKLNCIFSISGLINPRYVHSQGESRRQFQAVAEVK